MLGLDGLFEREVRRDGIALCLASLRTYYMAAAGPEAVAASEPKAVPAADPETAATQAPVIEVLEARTDLEAPTVGAADLLEAWRARALAVSPRVLAAPGEEVVEPTPAAPLETAAEVAAAAAAKAAAEAGAAEAASVTSEPRSRSVLDEVRVQLASERLRREQCEAELASLRRSTDEALDRQRSVAERGIRELQGEVARLQERAAVKEAVEERARAVRMASACDVEGSRQTQQSAPRTSPQAAEQESVQDGLREREAPGPVGTALPPPMDRIWQTSRSPTEGLPPYGPRDSASSPRPASDTCDGQDRREYVDLGLPHLLVCAAWVALYAAAIYATLAWLSVASQAEALDTRLE